jgi:hypothetical protein
MPEIPAFSKRGKPLAPYSGHFCLILTSSEAGGAVIVPSKFEHNFNDLDSTADGS